MPRQDEPRRLWTLEHDIPAEIVDDARQQHYPSNLARGIVWADVLADIAADEAARELPEAA